MAKAVEEYLTCPVCLDIFTEPVSLGCHHSFCSACLSSFWEQNNGRECPFCRRKSSKDNPGINFALKELCISFREEQKAKDQAQIEVVCSRHPEVPPLFCKDEGRAVCSVCEFTLHQQHTVVSVEEIVSELKEKLQSHLQSLQEKRERVKTVEKTYEELQQHSEKQAQLCERQIRAVFEQMHQFLKQEEEWRLEELRLEQQRQTQTMSPELERVREQLTSVDHTIQTIEEQLKNDRRTLIKEFNQTENQAKDQVSKSDPQPQPGLLLNQAKVLGNLGFKIWKKMRSIINYTPVILDPNTMYRRLYLSEDLTSVGRGETQQVLLNIERFSNSPIVLGSEGFSSGTHQWDVEIGDHPGWTIGVAKESINRKEEICISPCYGVWCLKYREGKYTYGKVTVPVQKPPEKIRVQLDYDEGQVSFYDADDMTVLYTHKYTFKEKLFPYFSVRRAGDARTKNIKICSTEGPQ